MLIFCEKKLFQAHEILYNQILFRMKKPQNYYCHRATNNVIKLPLGYEVIDKIGEGAFGQVFKVFNTENCRIQVMKCSKGEFPQTLNKQTEIMSKMETSDGFAKIKDRTNIQDFFIMTLLGENLQNIIEKYTLNVIDVKRIAYQCLLRLKDLHQAGFVHRDIKPENILLGNQNNPHKLYVVDFGLSSTYKKSAQVARKLYQGEIGTIKFCPIASHKCLQQYPKDDLESLGYLLVYLMTKDLPWARFPKGLDEREKFDLIRRLKEQTQVDKLCEGVVCLKKYLKFVKQLKVGQQIEYEILLQLFKIPCKDDYCFSFCQGGCFAKKKLGEQSQKQNQVEEESQTVKLDLHHASFTARKKKNL